MTTITTWEEFGEFIGELGLKMTNKTPDTDERKMVQLYYLVPA